MAVTAEELSWRFQGNSEKNHSPEPWTPDEVWSEPRGRAGSRGLTKWDSKQQKKRQADEITKSLFKFDSYEDRARGRLEEERIRNKEQLVEERCLKEKEVDELDRSAMALDAAICRLSELGKKQNTCLEKYNIGLTENGKAQKCGEERPAQTSKFGSNIEDLFAHSYQKPVTHRWVWVPRPRVLDAAKIGVPATNPEIRRFGASARTIQAVQAKKVDLRSFVEAAVEGGMDNRGGGRGSFRGGREEERKDYNREDRFRNHPREGEFERQGERFKVPYYRQDYRREGGNQDGYWDQGRDESGWRDDNRGAKRRPQERGARYTEEEDLRVKLMRDQYNRGGYGRDDGGGGSSERCFRCNETGHKSFNCPNPPICYNCQDKGHLAPNCPRNKENKGLRLCGYGLPGQLFYSIYVPIEEEEKNKSPLTAVLTIIQGKGSVSKVTTELQYLISSTWDWQVRKLDANTYMFVVPSAKDLEFLTKLKEFKCKISDMVVSVEKSDLMMGCSDMLTSVWVQLMGVPYWARKEKAVEEVAYLVGDFEELDKSTLPGLGPIRVKVSCKDPKEIKGASKVYFNKRGFMVSWLVESETTQKIKNGSKLPPENKDDGEEEEDEEEESDNYDPFREEGGHEASGQHTEPSKQGDYRTKKQTGGVVEANEHQGEKLQGEKISEIATEVTQVEVEEVGVMTMELEGKSTKEQMELYLDSEDQFLVHSQNSETMMGEVQIMKEDNSDPEKSEAHSSNYKQAVVVPIQAMRRSSRMGASTTPVQDKAEKIKASKNLQGTSQNPFTSFQTSDNSQLARIATECNLVLGSTEEEINGLINILKAKELAQAEIFRLEQAKAAVQEKVIVEEVFDSDEEGPEGHALIVEELTKIQEPISDDLLPEVGTATNHGAGKGKKKTKIK
jgi:hypothetical protein